MSLFNARCLCGPRVRISDSFASRQRLSAPNARGRADPTGTSAIRRRWRAELDRRWLTLSKMLPDAMERRAHPANMIQHSLLTGQDPIRAFQAWLDEALRQVVLGGNGFWLLSHVRLATDAGTLTANRLTPGGTSSAVPRDRTNLLQSLTIAELQGIIEAVSQQVVRAFADAAMTRASMRTVAGTARRVIQNVGVRRGRLLISFMAVRSFNAAALDTFRVRGVSRVGLVPEQTPAHARRKVGDDLEGLVEVLTAGDDDVCPACQDISDDGPYDLETAEGLIPAHPECRCAFVPADDERFANVREADDGFDPDEPRDRNGKWTSSGAAKEHLFGEASNFESINSQLRSDKVGGVNHDRVKAIDADIRTNGGPVPDGTVLYRGLSIDKSSPFLARIKSGQPIEELGYLSTTTDKKWADTALKGDLDKTDVMMELTASAERRPLALFNPAESEYLFQRGTLISVKSVENKDGALLVKGTIRQHAKIAEESTGDRIKTDQNRKLPKTFYHSTDNEEVLPSSSPDRLIPNSISLGSRDQGNLWGKNQFKVSIKPDAKVLHVDVNGKTNDFYNFGADPDTVKGRGADLRKFAEAKGYDAIYMTNVPAVGNELAVLNPKILEVKNNTSEMYSKRMLRPPPGAKLSDSATHVASGIMITADNTGRTLFLRRSDDHGDHGGEWAFPAGAVEPGETVEQAAARETREETGYDVGAPGDLEQVCRLETNGVDFTTYSCASEMEFRPSLNEEHDDYVWASKFEPPRPLHPGVDASLRAFWTGDAFNPDEPRNKDGKWTSGVVSSKVTPEDLEKRADYVAKLDGETEAKFMRFVAKNGKNYDFDKSSFGKDKLPEHMCFQNAARIALSDPSKKYVEGYLFLDHPGSGITKVGDSSFIHHAWNVDANGKVEDHTASGIGAIGYFGIEYKTSSLTTDKKFYGMFYKNLKSIAGDAFNPDQPRDRGGKWSPTGSAGLKKHLKFIAQVQGGRPSTAKFVLDHGRDYKFDADSFRGKRDEQKLCYQNAGRIAMNNSARTYVEGFVDFMGVPIQHAWTVDKNDRVVDTTLKNAEGVRGYFGVPFTTDYLIKTAMKTKVWGILSHTNRSLYEEKSTKNIVRDFDPNEARDPRGRWTASGTPAQDLLGLHHNVATDTMESVQEQLTPAQKRTAEDIEKEFVGKTPTNVAFVGQDGKYTAERAELHAKILDEMFTPEAIARATPRPGQAPVLTLTGGRPASGKTSTLQAELKDVAEHSFYISADTIQEHLPGYTGRYAGLYNAEGQDIALQAEKIARAARINITYDATLKSTQPAIERVDLYKKEGYEVDGYFVHTSPVTSAVRSQRRYETSGRFVPAIVSFNSRTNEKTFDTLIPKFRKWAVFDNNGPKPKKIAQGGAQ